MPKKKKQNIIYRNPRRELFKKRTLFIYQEIEEEIAERIVQQLLYLDSVNHKAITIYINSPGGYCTDGLAIVDAIINTKSKVITIIQGEACSMAGLISIVADERAITKNSVWMAHDVYGGGHDYGEKIYARVDNMKKDEKRMNKIFIEHTELTKKDLLKAKHEELWLFPEECLKKGVVDRII